MFHDIKTTVRICSVLAKDCSPPWKMSYCEVGWMLKYCGVRIERSLQHACKGSFCHPLMDSIRRYLRGKASSTVRRLVLKRPTGNCASSIAAESSQVPCNHMYTAVCLLCQPGTVVETIIRAHLFATRTCNRVSLSYKLSLSLILKYILFFSFSSVNVVLYCNCYFGGMLTCVVFLWAWSLPTTPGLVSPYSIITMYM